MEEESPIRSVWQYLFKGFGKDQPKEGHMLSNENSAKLY